MASGSGSFTLEELKRQAEEIGLEGKEKTKFLTEGWRRVQEQEAAERAAEREREAEKERLEREAEKERLEREAQTGGRREAESGKVQIGIGCKLELERMQLERERLADSRRTSTEDQTAVRENVGTRTQAQFCLLSWMER